MGGRRSGPAGRLQAESARFCADLESVERAIEFQVLRSKSQQVGGLGRVSELGEAAGQIVGVLNELASRAPGDFLQYLRLEPGALNVKLLGIQP